MNVELPLILFPPSKGENYGGCFLIFLFIGYQADNKCYFHGCIDDVTIYDRVLNRKEVMALYRGDL